MTVSENDIENAKRRVAKMNEKAVAQSTAQEPEENEKVCERADNSTLLFLLLFLLLSEQGTDSKTLLVLLLLFF